MKKNCGLRLLKMLAGGAFLIQITGCGLVEFNDFLQTVLLGVTAAGSVAILQNI